MGVAPRQLVAGKALGAALVLGLALVPVALLGVGAIALAAGEYSLLRSVDRLALLAFAYSLYFGGVLGIALAVSASARTARTALLGLVGLWVVGCLIVPRAAADAAEQLAPTTSYAAFWRSVEHDIEQGLDGTGSATERSTGLQERVLAEYGVKSVDELPVAYDGLSLQEGEDYANRVFDKHYGALWNTFERQNQIQLASAVVSPLVPIRALSSGLAGTDLAQHRHFAEAAERYRRTMVRQLNDEFRDMAGAAGYSYVDDGTLWEKVPDFDYISPSTSEIVRAHLAETALLVAWFAVGAAAAIIAAARLRPV